MSAAKARGLLYDQICYTRYLPPGDVPYVRMRSHVCWRGTYIGRNIKFYIGG